MSKNVYVVVVERVIRDTVELQIVVDGHMDSHAIEKKAEEMAAKLSGFDPGAMNTSVKTNMVALDLVASEPKKKSTDF